MFNNEVSNGYRAHKPYSYRNQGKRFWSPGKVHDENRYMPLDSEVNRWCWSLGKYMVDWQTVTSIHCDGEGRGPIFHMMNLAPFHRCTDRTVWGKLQQLSPNVRPEENVVKRCGASVIFCRWEDEDAIVAVHSSSGLLVREIPKGHILHVVWRQDMVHGRVETFLEKRFVGNYNPHLEPRYPLPPNVG